MLSGKACLSAVRTVMFKLFQPSNDTCKQFVHIIVLILPNYCLMTAENSVLHCTYDSSYGLFFNVHCRMTNYELLR